MNYPATETVSIKEPANIANYTSYYCLTSFEAELRGIKPNELILRKVSG
jgi:hypothetical protein